MKRQELTAHLNALQYVYRAHVSAAYSEEVDEVVASEIYVDADGQHATDNEVLLAFHVLYNQANDDMLGLRLDLGGCRDESKRVTSFSPMYVMLDTEWIARIGRDIAQTQIDGIASMRMDGKGLREQLHLVGQEASRARQFACEVVGKLGLVSSRR